jgi:hypothetical protein
MSILSKLRNSGMFESVLYIGLGWTRVLYLSYGNSEKLKLLEKIKVSIEQLNLGLARRKVI